MVIEFNPEGRVVMTLGRRPEPLDALAGRPPAASAANPGKYTFSRPTDVGWDADGNIFVSDGYGNSRVVKYDKNGKYITSIRTKGSEPAQFNLPHTLAVDAKGKCLRRRSEQSPDSSSGR